MDVAEKIIDIFMSHLQGAPGVHLGAPGLYAALKQKVKNVTEGAEP